MAQDLKPAGLLDGKYRLIRKLGGGGFGDVFLAEDMVLAGHRVAIKILRDRRESDNDALLREMRILAGLRHPGIAGFFHHFEHQETLHLVMEYCPGGNLRARMDTGSVSQELAFKWCRAMAETLQFVHKKGIVHHDIKPENILFGEDESLRIADFGVANSNGGTRFYMAPELLLGEQVSSSDPRIDVYALGITFLELLSTVELFAGMSADERLQAKIRHDFVPYDLAHWVQEIVLKAVHPTPELRFQSMGELCEAIDSRHVPYILDGNRIVAHRLAEKAEDLIERKKWKTAQKTLDLALGRSQDCVAALITVGRLDLLLRRISQAAAHLNQALVVNPRADVQKELGWIQLERKNYPQAISMLNDYLQRHAADFEACNLLLECFYRTDRYEQGDELAALMMKEKGHSGCFMNQRLIFRILSGAYKDEWLRSEDMDGIANPFIRYNIDVASEAPSSWDAGGRSTLKSKLLFQDYRFGLAGATKKVNTITVGQEKETPKEYSGFIVGVGRLTANEICLSGTGCSRRHAAIVNYLDDVWIHDLNSMTGVTVSGQRIDGKAFLDGVSEVQIGRYKAMISPKRGLLV
ncbi:MAG: protein kinase [Burkholderiales bacterium]|nr:protein kinase [Burkholderiales bacterium]